MNTVILESIKCADCGDEPSTFSNEEQGFSGLPDGIYTFPVGVIAESVRRASLNFDCSKCGARGTALFELGVAQ